MGKVVEGEDKLIGRKVIGQPRIGEGWKAIRREWTCLTD